MVACTRLSDRGKARKQGQTVEQQWKSFLLGLLLPVPGSQIVGKTRKKKAREKLVGREKGKRKREFPPVLFSC